MERFSLNSVESALLDLEAWPTIEEEVIEDANLRDTIKRLRRAIQLFVDRVSYDQIESETGVPGRMALYWFKRGLETHPDGRIWGFRVLYPHTHTAPYRRVAEVDRNYRSTRGGASGAFGQLLRAYPKLKELIDRHVLRLKAHKHVYESRLRLKSLHKRFLDLCRELNLDVGKQYPFNTATLGHRSLSVYVHKLIRENPLKAIPGVYGSAAAKTLQTGDGSNRPVFLPYARVECDGHHMDAIFTLWVPSTFGNAVSKTLPRLWIITLEEILSTAILGYHRSSRTEPNSEDVLAAVKHALSKWEPLELRLPTLQYRKGAGFPSSHNPRLLRACWEEFSVDEALANVADRVKSKLDQVVGNEPTTLKRHNPNDRPFMESFYGVFEENGFHRLPNTTGTGPKDPRRKDPEKAALKFDMQMEHADEITDVILANYNATPKTSLGGRTPLEYLDYLCEHHECWPRQADQLEVEKLLAVRRLVVVRGNIAEGRRPHINFSGGRYTSDVLRNAFDLIGKKIWIEIPEDIRTVRAYTENGAELGPLQAAPPWHHTPHTLEIRRAIRTQINNGVLHYVEGHDPVMDYTDFLEDQIRTSKKVPPLYIELRRILTGHWQEMTPNESLGATSILRPNSPVPTRNPEAPPTRLRTSDGSESLPRRHRMAVNG